MPPTAEPIDEIYRDRVRRARAMSLAEKFLDGPRLFEMACRITMSGTRNQFPDADERRVKEILSERLALRRRLEEGR